MWSIKTEATSVQPVDHKPIWGEISVKLHRGAVAQLGCMVVSFGYGVFLFGYGLFIQVWSFHFGMLLFSFGYALFIRV